MGTKKIYALGMSKKNKSNRTANVAKRTDPPKSNFSILKSAVGLAYASLTLFAAFGITGAIYDRYARHEEIENSLNEIITVIILADGGTYATDLDEGWITDRLQRKLDFVQAAQKNWHSPEIAKHGLRFKDLNAWSNLPALKTAANTFQAIERKHHKEYSQLILKAKWSIAEKKHLIPEAPRVPSTLPNILLEGKARQLSSSSSYPNTIKGVYVNTIPSNMRNGEYPTIDLSQPQTKLELKRLGADYPEKVRYFIPDAGDLQRLHTDKLIDLEGSSRQRFSVGQ